MTKLTALISPPRYFHTCDAQAELEVVRDRAMKAGAFAAVVSTHHGEGGKGAAELVRVDDMFWPYLDVWSQNLIFIRLRVRAGIIKFLVDL